MSAKKKKNEKPTKPQLWLVRDTDPRAPFGGDVWIVWCVGIEAATAPQPAADTAPSDAECDAEIELQRAKIARLASLVDQMRRATNQ